MNTCFAMVRFWLLQCSMVAGACAGSNALAQTVSPQAEVRHMVQAGQLTAASKEIARQLQRPEPEPGMQLLQCVVQAQQNQTDKAIVCLSTLIKQRPDMLEAYNNLGVLYASKGQHEEAQRWFTLALQRQPTLWTLHQNLQSLQADLARKAYSRALQNELPLKNVPAKLTMLGTTTLTQTAVVQTAKPAEPAPTPLPISGLAGPDNKPTAFQTAGPVTDEKGQAQKIKTNSLDDATRQQLQEAVQAWAQAWSAQNMKAYFAAYTPEYTPGKSMTRAAWEAERTDRIAGREFVRVKVSNFSFENTGTKVIARFNQFYESGNLQSTHRKRLELVQQESQWKIARETVISN